MGEMNFIREAPPGGPTPYPFIAELQAHAKRARGRSPIAKEMW